MQVLITMRKVKWVLIIGETGAYEGAAGEALVTGLFTLIPGAYNGRIRGLSR
jgi:hypothetical protein